MDKKKIKETNDKVPDLGKNLAKVAPLDLNLADPKPKIEGLRLNMGCGTEIKKGFLNVDKYYAKADAQWDILDIPLNDDSVAQVMCYEVLEHIPMKQIEKALSECYRILKPNGTIVLTVPDIISYCKNVVNDPDNEYNITRIYGNQSHQGQFHFNGFTPKTLFRLLGNAGFRTIGVAYFDSSPGVVNIFCEAQK